MRLRTRPLILESDSKMDPRIRKDDGESHPALYSSALHTRGPIVDQRCARGQGRETVMDPRMDGAVSTV